MRRPELAALIALALVTGCDAGGLSSRKDQEADQSGPATKAACRLPDRIEPAAVETVPARERRDVPASGYVLALSWSPEFCRFRSDDPKQALQCRDNRFGFVVHGLWPQAAGRLQPRHCAPTRAIDEATMRTHLCMMPSPELMQDQWAAHGTCGWQSARDYFARTAELRRRLQMPDVEALPREGLTAGKLRDALVAANPGLPHDAVFIDRTSRGWLEEVRICYDLSFTPAACPRRQTGAPDRAPVKVWRRDG